MLRKKITQPNIVILILCLQFIPLILMPPDSYSPTTQEWWLPMLLLILALVAVVQLVFRQSIQLWPWFLISFAQGFNIISRLMLFMPKASILVDGQVRINGLYVSMTLISMLISAFYIIYTDLPDVRMSLITRHKQQPG